MYGKYIMIRHITLNRYFPILDASDGMDTAMIINMLHHIDSSVKQIQSELKSQKGEIKAIQGYVSHEIFCSIAVLKALIKFYVQFGFEIQGNL